jgi:hypothetical protein
MIQIAKEPLHPSLINLIVKIQHGRDSLLSSLWMGGYICQSGVAASVDDGVGTHPPEICKPSGDPASALKNSQ